VLSFLPMTVFSAAVPPWGRSQPRRATRHGSSVDRRRSSREQKRYRAHGFLNLLMIGLVMWPSRQQQVKPALSKSLHKWYYEAAIMHAALGITAELPGLYIVIVAGTKVLPQWLRFKQLEVADAHGARTLGDCPAQWYWNVLRMVCAIPVEPGQERSLTHIEKAFHV
jgi:hypothetical protein